VFGKQQVLDPESHKVSKQLRKEAIRTKRRETDAAAADCFAEFFAYMEGEYFDDDENSDVIMVTVTGATGLKGKDRLGAVQRGVYCTCEVPGKKKTQFKTAVASDPVNPNWNCTREVSSFELGDVLKFSVYGKDPVKDEYIGEVSLGSASVLPRGFSGSLTLNSTTSLKSKASKSVNAAAPSIQVVVTTAVDSATKAGAVAGFGLASIEEMPPVADIGSTISEVVGSTVTEAVEDPAGSKPTSKKIRKKAGASSAAPKRGNKVGKSTSLAVDERERIDASVDAKVPVPIKKKRATRKAAAKSTALDDERTIGASSSRA